MLKQILESRHINPVNAFRLMLAMHIAGAIGLAIPASQELFQLLTPFNLLATAAIIFHFEEKKTLNYFLLILVTFFVGYAVEVAGVHTGAIFGEYSYGATLGIKLFDVPLAIGLNWAILIYASGLASDKLPVPRPVKVLAGAAIMVLMDLLIEPVAIRLDFWSWVMEDIPLQNYIAWFALSLALHLFYQFLPFSKNNPLAIRLLYIQGLFFLALNFI
ncbi:MAG: carotenoid biosynthesis protein [Roseivirga sp.]|nr:carotenoid biosynthesis protein [Roseivirga sp.]